MKLRFHLAIAMGMAVIASASFGAEPVSNTESYALDICPVSGEKLGSMGDPITREIEGREVKFCCEACIAPYEADVEGFSDKIDEAIIAQQKDHYPLDTCVVMDQVELGEMGDPVDYVYGNRLVRFCCGGCVSAFEDDPEQYIKKLDAAVVEQQREDYPLDTCVVMGRPLGSDPIEVVIANRLVRLCCPGCVSDIAEEPAKYFEAIDEAKS